MVYGSHQSYMNARTGDTDAYRSFRDLDLVVEQAVRTLTNYMGLFSSIVCTGTSGMVAAAPVALRLKVPLVVVRKKSPDDICGGGDVIGERDLGESPLFFDDLISSGTTFLRCEEKIGIPFPYMYTYESNHFQHRREFPYSCLSKEERDEQYRLQQERMERMKEWVSEPIAECLEGMVDYGTVVFSGSASLPASALGLLVQGLASE